MQNPQHLVQAFWSSVWLPTEEMKGRVNLAQTSNRSLDLCRGTAKRYSSATLLSYVIIDINKMTLYIIMKRHFKI